MKGPILSFEEWFEGGSVEPLLGKNKNNMKESKFAFLTSTRFYAVILNSVSITLLDPSFPIQAWYVTLGKLFALLATQFIAIKSWDRNSDKKVEAAEAGGKMTTVSMPNSVSSVTATTDNSYAGDPSTPTMPSNSTMTASY